MEDNFYTYIYYDPSRGNEPIYVGKGHGTRAWQHLTKRKKHPFIQRLQYMRKNNIVPIIGLYAGYDEEFSLFLEEELISKIGRKDLGNGPLLNLTDGGEGVSNPSEYTRLRIGKANKGIKRTAEQIKINSDARKGVPTGRKGKPNPMKKSEPHRNIGKVRSQEFKDNLSAMYKGKVAWNKGIASSKTECIHCKKLVDAGNMKQHHGDNCRYKENPWLSHLT